MRRTLAIAAVVLLPLTACGDDDGGDTGAPETTGSSGTPADGEVVTVPALDSLSFGEDSYTAPAGQVTFVYENEGSLPHTLVIEGIPEDEFKLAVGDTDEGSVELEPGEYTMFCDVPGHRSGGMEATLTVE